MQKVAFLFTLIIVILFSSCKKKEEYFIEIQSGLPYPEDKGSNNLKALEGAEIWVYKSEQDYLLDKNYTHYGRSDSNGKFKFKETEEFNYFFRIKRDSLNEVRFRKEYIKPLGRGRDENRITINYFIPLSTTPAKLQINVLKNGNPVPNAEVQIFYSEKDYLENKIPGKYNINTSGYENLAYGELFDNSFFYKRTNEEGIAYFENLEAREYWFKVVHDGFSNSATIFKTNEKLSENPDITTVLTVPVK